MPHLVRREAAVRKMLEKGRREENVADHKAERSERPKQFAG